MTQSKPTFVCDFKHNTHPFIDSLRKLMLIVIIVMHTYVTATTGVCNISNDCNGDDVDAHAISKQ